MDLIATGTDIKPVEIVMFMRSVKSRVLFEQMKGRGVRVINPDELRAVTPDAQAKTHFLIVDCVGVSERKLSDTKPLDKNPSVSLKALLDHVAANGTHEDYLSSLASRLSRIDKQCGPEDRTSVAEVSDGARWRRSAPDCCILHATPTRRTLRRGRCSSVPPDAEPTDEQLRRASEPLKKAAIQPLMSKPALRKLILDLRQKFEQIVDEVSRDELIGDATGLSQDARDKASALVHSFEAYLGRAQGRDRGAAVLLFSATQEAAAIQGHQGAGRRDLGAAALVDAGEAVARVRDAGEVEGARRIGWPAVGGHSVAGAFCGGSG